METWTFQTPRNEQSIIPGVRRRLLNVPQLVRHHPDAGPVRVYWSKLVDCFSREQWQACRRMLSDPTSKRRAWDPLPRFTIFQADGALVYEPGRTLRLGRRGFTLDARGRFDVTAALRDIVHEQAVDSLVRLPEYKFDGLWRRRVELFDQALQLCQEEGIAVVFVRTPLHPIAWELLEAYPEHAANDENLQDLLAEWQRRYPTIVGTVDASRVERFGGNPDGFLDEMHCGPDNSRLILDEVARLLMGKAASPSIAALRLDNLPRALTQTTESWSSAAAEMGRQ